MQTAPSVLSLFLIFLSYSGWTNGLCNLENGTVARCTELVDVKGIEASGLETLKVPAVASDLTPSFFDNLTTLRHLDLSGGDLQRLQPGVFRKLTNLRSLNLAENEIETLDTGVVQGLHHLHSLNLRRNNLRELPSGIVEIKSLRHLDVQGNPLQCNCATLLVRDLIANQGVKISKKTVCAGPKHVKGTSLIKPDATITCNLEEQDREMQNDQPFDESEQEYGSGSNVDTDVEQEFVNIPEIFHEPIKAPETETPVSVETCLPGDPDCPASTTSKEEEIFFDSAEKKRDPVTPPMGRKKMYKDALFSPIEGSGDDEDGSGEGSGTGTIFDGWDKAGETIETTDGEEESQSFGEKLLDTIFNVFLSTSELPETKKDLDLEGEQFIDASMSKADEKAVVTKKITEIESAPVTTSSTTEATRNITTIPVQTNVEVFAGELPDLTKKSNVQVEENATTDDLAEVSAAKQAKKGIGSYVVLAALLAILATLIVFAAYKGDFCKKKRKRGDLESGTEMKDMQKSLLDTGNATQPKVVTNGNVENVPLVEDPTDHEETRTSNDHDAIDTPRPLNGTSERIDPVKPPRKSNGRSSPDANSLKNDSSPARTSLVDVTVNNVPLLPANGPPLSPGAQRVKITLQENPDSVPKTPILITRTMAGENLVKTP